MRTKHKTLFTAIALILISWVAYAEVGDFVPGSYTFHLYYDNGQLLADRDFQFKYDVTTDAFVPETLNTQFPYKGEVIDLKNDVAATFQFDPRRGNPNLKKGKISVKGPYFADAQKVNFYNSEGRQLLSIFVSDSSFCDDNGMCNADRGEDTKTCPNDCKTTPSPTTVPGEEDAVQGRLLMPIIYSTIGIALLGGLWWFYRRKKAANTLPPDINIPPPIPPLANK